MKALVIGPGYVGKALALELASLGHQVTVLRRSNVCDDDLVRAGIQSLQADITRPEDLRRTEPAYDWVANCAGSSVGGVEDYRRTYLEGARNIVMWLAGSQLRKYVYTSSTGVYGQNDGSTVDELSPAEPDTDTGKVLVETENLLLRAASTTGFPATTLRVAGIYGPGRGYWLKQFLAGETRLQGDGQRILNMIHRDDVAGAMNAAFERGKPGAIYNAADDEPVTQRVLFEWLAGKLGRPMPEAGGDPSDRVRRVGNKRISNLKLRNELGYKFKYPTFREGYASVLAPRSSSS